MTENNYDPNLTPTQWLLSVAPNNPPRHQRLRDALRTRFQPSGTTQDISADPDGVMRTPDGRPWIPTTEPTWHTGLFGRARRCDWIHHSTAAQSQVRALARRAAQRQGDD